MPVSTYSRDTLRCNWVVLLIYICQMNTYLVYMSLKKTDMDISFSQLVTISDDDSLMVWRLGDAPPTHQLVGRAKAMSSGDLTNARCQRSFHHARCRYTRNQSPANTCLKSRRTMPTDSKLQYFANGQQLTLQGKRRNNSKLSFRDWSINIAYKLA